MRIKLPKTVKNILISAGTMLVLFVIAGLVYVYITGRSGEPTKAVKSTAKTSQPDVIKPVAPAANAPEGVAIESFTTPVKSGENTSMSIRTNAGSVCTILVTYANGVVSKDSGLAPKTADVYGFVTWTWTVDSSVPVGVWPVKATCNYHDRSGVVIGNLEVTN